MTSFDASVGLRIKFFQKKEWLPRVRNVGDVIVIRNVLKTQWVGGSNFCGNKVLNTKTIVFPGEKIPDPAFGATACGDQMEMLPNPASTVNIADEQIKLYVMHLRKWAVNNSLLDLTNAKVISAPLAITPDLRLPPRPQGPLPAGPFAARAPPVQATRDKSSLLKDVADRSYYDIVGEVRKIWGDNSGSGADLYLTDYTSNSLFFDYSKNPDHEMGGQDGDEHGYITNRPKRIWPGPSGKMTVQIRLWPPHHSCVLNEGDFVYLRNVHIKYKKANCLEGTLYEDKKHPEQIDIRPASSSDPRVVALKKRREEYWANEEIRDSPNDGVTNLKGKRARAQKKKAKKEAAKKLKLEGHGRDDGEAVFDPKVAELSHGKKKTNPHGELRFQITKLDKVDPEILVTCSHTDKELLTVSSIIETPHLRYRERTGEEAELPFVNMKTRARVRVVDFYPPDLEDFAQCIDDPTYNDSPSQPDHSSPMDFDDSSQLAGRWEWAFYLMVEDPKSAPGETAVQLPLLVAGKDAECLLSLDASEYVSLSI